MTEEKKHPREGLPPHPRAPVLQKPFLDYTEAQSNYRGHLIVWDPLPFEVVRSFLIFNVPFDRHRGQHGHKTCKQIIYCVRGTFQLHLKWHKGVQPHGLEDNAIVNETYDMFAGMSVYVKPQTWIHMDGFDSEGVAFVECSEGFTTPINTWERMRSVWAQEMRDEAAQRMSDVRDSAADRVPPSRWCMWQNPRFVRYIHLVVDLMQAEAHKQTQAELEMIRGKLKEIDKHWLPPEEEAIMDIYKKFQAVEEKRQAL